MSTLDDLLRRPDLLWRLGDRRDPVKNGLPTGVAALDKVLWEGGWPRGGLVELLADRHGIGELRLLLPALGRLSDGGQYQVWIDPPYLPFAPMLMRWGIDFRRLVIVRPAEHRQRLWAAEQALRSPGCGAVVMWAGGGRMRYAELRKLQVAAAERGTIGFILTPSRTAESSSPAVLRLRLTAAPTGLAIEVVKQRGTRAGQTLEVALPATLAKQRPLREQPVIVSAPPRRTLRPLRRLPTPVVRLRPESWL
jgi:protein ImuA